MPANQRNFYLNTGAKIVIAILLIASIASVQWLYDETKVAPPSSTSNGLSAETVRMFDMGFHSTTASFLWINTMPEILDLFNNKTEYLGDEAYINQVDPKLSYPYAFSVLTLPAVPTSTGFTAGLQDSFVIGAAGMKNADPDWRIPFYIATNYYLGLDDMKDAAIYFNLAAQTPGIPDYAQRFALNFGNEQKDRDRTIALWQTIYQTTNDPDTKARAEAYIDHLEIFNYLEAAAAAYKKEFGVFPTDPNQLVAKGIIPSVPVDPFGEIFTFTPSGTVDVSSTAP